MNGGSIVEPLSDLYHMYCRGNGAHVAPVQLASRRFGTSELLSEAAAWALHVLVDFRATAVEIVARGQVGVDEYPIQVKISVRWALPLVRIRDALDPRRRCVRSESPKTAS